MSTYKYPYIPRDYYPAVMFACKMIRENGYFNRAIKRAASYYKVDKDKLTHYVRARQAAGQKGQEGWSKGAKFHWYAMHTFTEAGYSVEIVKAIDKDHAIKKVFHGDEYVLQVVDYKECKTKQEAEGYADKWNAEG